MVRIARCVCQLFPDFPPRAYDGDWFISLFLHHSDWGHEISVGRDYCCQIKQIIPSIVKQMCRKIHIGALLFRGVVHRKYSVWHDDRVALSPLSRSAHGQHSLRDFRDQVISFGKRHRWFGFDPLVGHWKVDERAPDCLLKKISVVYPNLRQRFKCVDVDLLSGWCVRIRKPGYMSSEITQPVQNSS